MITIHKKDSIIDIIIKINHSTDDKIVLDFPFGHPILHNQTSLKILKNNVTNRKTIGTKHKELIIITNDITAKKIGRKLGIKYSLSKSEDLLHYNYTFNEYSRVLFKSYVNEIKGILKKEIIPSHHHIIKKSKDKISNLGFFLFGLGVIICLFLFIFYFAVNKTYVYISPEITIKTKAKNLYFTESTDDLGFSKENEIRLKKISKTIGINQSFGASGVDESSLKKSTGEVVFTNNYFETTRLLPHTRLETNEGILFETTESLDIPPAIKNSLGEVIPGKIKAKIQAKFYDREGKIIGSLGNIQKGVVLTLPGLKDEKNKLFAHTSTIFTGGTNQHIKIIAEDDLENSKKILETKLRQEALQELKKQIEVENEINNATYEILGINDIIYYTDLSIFGSENIKKGEKKENYTLSGSIQITSYTYNKELVLNKLKTVVEDTVLQNIESLLFLNNDSLRIAEVLERKEDPLSIKASTQVEAFVSHNFLSQDNNYTEKLKNKILGLSRDDAIQLLLNDPKISDVKIETRPFFIKKISKLPKNIIFKVLEK